MKLTDAEKLLNTQMVGAADEAVYQARLDAAIDQAKQYCNRDFLNTDGLLEIPKGAQLGVALILKAMGETQSVASQSLGDMSKSFFENGTYKAGINYLKPYRRLGFK